MTRVAKILFSAFSLLIAFSLPLQAQDVIKASGATNISVDSLFTGGYVTISGPTIRETASGQLTQGGTIVLTLPGGYEWNTALTAGDITITIDAPGSTNTDLLVSFTSVTAQNLTFTVDDESVTAGKGKGPGRVTIGGLQLRPATSTVPDAGTISNTGTTGPNLNYGNLSKVPGAIDEISVETASDGSGQVVAAQDLLAGNSITVYSIARDQAGNFIENKALSSESDWSLIDITGNVAGGALTPAGNLRSAIFSSQATGSAKIQAVFTGATPIVSGDITVLPRPADYMQIQTQPSATATAGETYPTQPVIFLFDQFDNKVTTDNSTQVTASIGSGNGTLSGTTTITSSGGEITFSDLSSEIANTITLDFTSSGLSTITSNNILVEPNVPVDLTYLEQPINTAQNSTITPPVELQLLDIHGNAVSQANVAVTITNGTGNNIFKNNSTLQVNTNANGIAVFSSINLLNNAPEGPETLVADFPTINSPVSSNTFNIISSNDLAKFVVQNTNDADIGDQTAGQEFNIRIKALDGNDNIFTAFQSTVFITADATIDGGSFETANFVNGVLDTTITLNSTGITRIFAENTVEDRTGRSNEFNILPGVYDETQTLITANPTQITADGSSTSTITVQLKDAFGNNLITGGETVELSTTAGSFGGSASIMATDQNDGTYTATLTSSTNANETATITGTINTTDSISDDATVDFIPGSIANFTIALPLDSGSPAEQVAGTPFQIDITAVDAQGNTVSSFDGTASITTNSVITSGSSVSFSSGQALNHSVTLTQSGTNVTLTATADNLFDVTGTSNSFVVSAASPSAAESEVNVSPSTMLNENTNTSTVTIILRDQFNNRVLSQQTVGIALEQIELNNAPSSGTPDASISGITYNSGPSTYTATITASTTIELIEITGSFGNPATNINQTGLLDIVVPKTWVSSGGPTATDWNNADNWDPTGVPDADEFVVIPDNGTAPELDLNVTVASLEIQTGVSLVLFGGNSINVSGNLVVDGTLDIEDNTDIDINGGFLGSGSFSAGDQTTVQIEGDVSLTTFLARTTGTIVTLDGSVPQTISTESFSAQTIQIQNDVDVASGNNLLDFGVLNISTGNTFELTNGAGITIDIEQEITGSGTFILNDNTFVLFGNATLNNIDASTGTVIFGVRLEEDPNNFPSLTQQTIANLDNINSAIINNTAGVRTTSDVEVSGSLTLENGPLIIGSGQSLIAPNITYTNGFIRMRRSINSTRGWRMISPPVASTYADFLDNTVTQGYTGSSLGNDPADSLQPNVLWYLESAEGTDNQRWRAPGNAADNLTPGRGLFVFFFGSIATDDRYNTPLPLTLEIDGEENVGNGSSFTFPVTYTANADTGWNLVGNPFAATLNWDSGGWTKTNMDNVLYVWDPSSGSYKEWNGISGSLGSGRITPFQAFWVKANAASPVLTVQNSAKTTSGTFKGKINKEPAALGLLLKSDGLEKSTHITFSNDGRTGKDIRDAFRLLPFDEDTYLEFFTTLKNGTQLSINNLDRNFGAELSIPIYVGGFINGQNLNGSYAISWPEFLNVPDSWELKLEDQANGTIIDLREELEYTFNVSQSSNKKYIPNTIEQFKLTQKPNPLKSAGSSDARFILKISPGEDRGNLPEKFELFNNYPNPFNPTTKIKFSVPIEGNVSLIVYDILGRKVSELTNRSYRAGFHEISWDARNVASGFYIYRLTTQNGVFSKKMMLIK